MGFFSKHKESIETKQTAEIKQATISDSQQNSIQNQPASQSQQIPAFGAQTPQVDAQQQAAQPSNFVNPFAEQQNPMQTPNPAIGQPGEQQTIAQHQEDALPQFNSQAPNIFETQMSQTPQVEQNAMPQFGQPSLTPELGRPFPQHQAEAQSTFTPQASNPLSQHAEQVNTLNLQDSSKTLTEEKTKELIVETVEKIIEEKWDTFTDKVEKIVKWKEKTDAEIQLLKEDIVNIGNGFTKLETKLLNKISSYDKDILDVSSEIKALEKVFQKITPTLINNVNELSKITENLRSVDSKKEKNDENK